MLNIKIKNVQLFNYIFDSIKYLQYIYYLSFLFLLNCFAHYLDE